MSVPSTGPRPINPSPASQPIAPPATKLELKISSVGQRHLPTFDLTLTLPNIPKDRISFIRTKGVINTIKNAIRLIYNKLFFKPIYEKEYALYHIGNGHLSPSQLNTISKFSKKLDGKYNNISRIVKQAQESFNPNLSIEDKCKKLIDLKIKMASLFDPNSAGTEPLAKYIYAEKALSSIRSTLSKKINAIAPTLIPDFAERMSAIEIGNEKGLASMFSLKEEVLNLFFNVSSDFNIILNPALEEHRDAIEDLMHNLNTTLLKGAMLSLTYKPTLKLLPSNKDDTSFLKRDLAEILPSQIIEDTLNRARIQFPGEDASEFTSKRHLEEDPIDPNVKARFSFFETQIESINSKSKLALSKEQLNILTRLILGFSNQSMTPISSNETGRAYDTAGFNCTQDLISEYIIDVTPENLITINLKVDARIVSKEDPEIHSGFRSESNFIIQIDPSKLPDSLSEVTVDALLDSGCVSIGQHPTHMAYSTANN